MNLEALERFVMDMINVLFDKPREYTASAVKSTVASGGRGMNAIKN